MKFLDSLQKGLEAAHKADGAKREVIGIFESLNTDLKQFNEASISICRGVSAAGTMEQARKALQIFAGADPDREYLDADRLLLQVQPIEGGKLITADVAKWRQHVNGYPCVISFEGNTFNCFSAKDLEAALQELLSSTTFGRSLYQALAELKNVPNNDETP